jgi:pimeloyl-ACP methyl ester carboxylesterase
LLSDSELHMFDDCGHLITSDKPKDTADTIIDFLKRHPYL